MIMMDTRRGGIMLVALAMGVVSTGLPDTAGLIAFLLFGVLAIVAVLLPNQSQKRKQKP
jgi:hypothetical protein